MALLPLVRKTHWQAPTVIVLAFIAGLTFAIGHHVFYDHLDGKSVNNRLFDQQINLAVGQALVFLVRAALIISVGASYWQVFWGTVLHHTLALSQIDVLAGMLGSALDLLNLRASATRPKLLALALLSWMVPLASILPPATLSIHSTTRSELVYLHVPVPQFDGTSMAILSWGARGSGDSSETEYVIPFEENSIVNGALPLEDRSSLGGVTGGAASVYLAMRSQRLPYDFDNWDLLNCSLYNASYSVNITSDSNSQGALSKPDVRILNSVPFGTYAPVRTISLPLPANESAVFGI